MRLGNRRWESNQFNSRLQPTQLGLGTSATDTSLWKTSYDYGTTALVNNGNVTKQTIVAPKTDNQLLTLPQTYSYDALNRLESAVEGDGTNQTWKQTFPYDRFGNRSFDFSNSNTTVPAPPSQQTEAQVNPAINIANNRFAANQGYNYDAAGNLTNNTLGQRFVYDGVNKQANFWEFEDVFRDFQIAVRAGQAVAAGKAKVRSSISRHHAGQPAKAKGVSFLTPF